MSSNYVGSDSSKHLTFPSFKKIADGFGFDYFFMDVSQDRFEDLGEFLSMDGSKIIEIYVDPNARVIPQTKFGRPNEDLEPLLNRNSFEKYMLIESMRT